MKKELLCISQDEMTKINKIQLEIFKEFIHVCDTLNLKYYAVHGTLLGAIKYNGFFPLDDDIDVAMPRKDYEIFIKEGQKFLTKNLFIQSHNTEKEYPLVFAKLKDSNTAFIQPVLDNFDINKGIYIDIFPVDYYFSNMIREKVSTIKDKILTLRVSERFNTPKSTIRKIAIVVSKLFYPNWYRAMNKKNNLYSKNKKNDYCIVYGGKPSERNIRFDIFGEGKAIKFENMKIVIPQKYDEYLKIIYGDYNNYNPAEKYMKDDGKVEISANIIDTKKSYKEYK